MPPASVVLSLPAHPGFFWPGLLFLHVELRNPGGKCCLAGVDWSGGAWFGPLSRWQHEIRDVTGAGTAEVRLQPGSCSLILAV